jgi:hypothetical protein
MKRKCKTLNCKNPIPKLFGGSPPSKYQLLICPDCLAKLRSVGGKEKITYQILCGLLQYLEKNKTFKP